MILTKTSCVPLDKSFPSPGSLSPSINRKTELDHLHRPSRLKKILLRLIYPTKPISPSTSTSTPQLFSKYSAPNPRSGIQRKSHSTFIQLRFSEHFLQGSARYYGKPLVINTEPRETHTCIYHLYIHFFSTIFVQVKSCET